MKKDYFSHILPNGLRIVHLPSASPVSYCGFAVNAGTRDEEMDEFGLAHFVEHMIFKGTEKRKSWHILNRMENVGGEQKRLTHRLNRIEGQVRGLKDMLQKDAYCPDILIQVSAVSAALNSFSKELLATHIRTCVADGIRQGDDAVIDELVTTLQKLMK